MTGAAERSRAVKLVTVDSHGAEYFFHAVQGAIFLSRELGADVDVLMIPFDPLPQRRARRESVRRNAPEGAGTLEEAYYERFARGEPLELRRAGRRITFSHVRPSLGRRIACTARGAAAALAIAAGALGRGGRLRFIGARCRGAPVGDLAAASFLRSPVGGLGLDPHPMLLAQLAKACRLVYVAEWISSRARAIYTMTPEPSYVHSAPQRFLLAQGATEVSIHRPCAAVELVGPGAPSRARAAVADAALRTRVEDYLNTRLHDSRKALYYMTAGQNDNAAAAILDSRSQPVALPERFVYPIVFLQSLMDAPYLFGVDGFATMADWAFHTIDRCVANPGVERVLVKPHPGADYVAYPKDGKLLAAIERRYAGEPRVVVLSPRASLVRLCGGTRIVGLTRFGSVAEELVYLGQPVIASRCAPWGSEYRFARTWATAGEYDRLLDTISPATWKPPTDAERAELYRYIADNRLCEVGPESRFPRAMLADLRSRACGDGPAPFESPAYRRHAHALDYLSERDPMFAQLLELFERP